MWVPFPLSCWTEWVANELSVTGPGSRVMANAMVSCLWSPCHSSQSHSSDPLLLTWQPQSADCILVCCFILSAHNGRVTGRWESNKYDVMRYLPRTLQESGGWAKYWWAHKLWDCPWDFRKDVPHQNNQILLLIVICWVVEDQYGRWVECT